VFGSQGLIPRNKKSNQQEANGKKQEATAPLAMGYVVSSSTK
tara:strand:+ start:4627 stop:4752 length:126 start_codon:yes stop_codon:yes gene_type:complete